MKIKMVFAALKREHKLRSRRTNWFPIFFIGGMLGGIAIGSAAVLLRPPLVGEWKLFSEPSYLPPTHLTVWPKKNVAETASQKSERLEMPILNSVPEPLKIAMPISTSVVTVQPTLPAAEHSEVKKLQIKSGKINTHKNRLRGREKSIQQDSLPTADVGVETDKTFTAHPKLLDQIRSDPRRIYIDESIQIDKLTFGVNNVSPSLGVEVWVSGDDYMNSSIYYPKVRVGAIQGEFEGQMISAGQKYYGTIPVSDLKNKKKIDIFFSAANVPERKVTVKLEW